MVTDNLGFTFAAARQTLTSVAGLELLASLIRRLDLIRAIRSEVRVKKIDYGFREEEHLFLELYRLTDLLPYEDYH